MWGLRSCRPLVVPTVLASFAIACGLFVITIGVCGIFNDDAVYVSTARALAEGRGYRLINLPAAPLQTQYPILYPAVLAVIWRIWPAFPANLIAMQGLSVLLAGAVMASAYLYAIRVQGCRRVAAAFGLALCATSPVFAFYSTQILTEIPFALCLIVTLWAVASEQERPMTARGRSIAIGAAIALPGMVRLIGFVVAFPLLWSIWRRTGRLLWYAVGALVPLGAWLAWAWTMRHGAAPVRAAMNHPDSWDWLGQLIRHEPWRPAIQNSLTLTISTVGFLPGTGIAANPILFLFLGVLTWLLVARGRNPSFAPALIAYIGVVLVWPWPSGRFLVPLWPLLGPFFLDRIQARIGAVVVVCMATVAIAGNLIELQRMSQRNRATHYPTLPRTPAPPSWAAFERLFTWVRTNTQPDATVIALLDPMLFLYTGRPALRPFDVDPLALYYGAPGNPAGTLDEFAALLTRRRGQYLVQTAAPLFAEEAPYREMLHQLRTSRPDCVASMYRDAEDPRFEVLAINVDGCSAPAR